MATKRPRRELVRIVGSNQREIKEGSDPYCNSGCSYASMKRVKRYRSISPAPSRKAGGISTERYS